MIKNAVKLYLRTLTLCILGCQCSVSLLGMTSLVILQDSADNSLLRISFGSATVERIASGVPGIAFLKDKSGGFFVLSRHSLTRVALDGTKTALVQDYPDSDWSAFVQLEDGSFVVADRFKNQLYRIRKNGDISVFALIPDATKPSLFCELVLSGRNLLLFRLGDDEALRLFEISQSGEVKTIKVTGAVRSPGKPHFANQSNRNQNVAFGLGPILSDEEGGFYFVDVESTRKLYQLTKSGDVRRLMSFGAESVDYAGMLLDSNNKRILLFHAPCIYSIDIEKFEKSDKPVYCNLLLTHPIQMMWSDGLKEKTIVLEGNGKD